MKVKMNLSEIGLFRIALGLHNLVYCKDLGSNLSHYFGSQGMINPDLIVLPKWSFIFLIWNQMEWITVSFIFMVVLNVLFVGGVGGRKVAVGLLFFQLSFYNANPLIIHEAQQIANFLLLASLFLPYRAAPCFFQKKDCVSNRKLDEAALLVNLLIIFLGVYYFFAGAKKIPDPLWRSGEALKYLIIWPGTGYDNVLTDFLLRHESLMKVVTYMTLIFELLFLPLIFTRWRIYLIILGVTMHVLILFVFLRVVFLL